MNNSIKYRGSERGGAGVKFLIVFVLILLTAHAGYNYVPVAYSAENLKGDMQAAVLQGTLGWHRYLRGELAASRAEYERAVDLDTDFDEGHAGVIRAAAWLGDAVGVEAGLAAGLARRDDLRGVACARSGRAVRSRAAKDRS